MWGALIGAGLGAIAGSQKDVVDISSGLRIGGPTELEQQGSKAVSSNFTQLGNFVNAGPGQADVANAYGSSQSLANMLKQYANGGFLPGEQDFATANKFAGQVFQPQQVAMQQQFGQQKQRAAQLAAQMGRPVNDPIIQAKLSQEFMQGQERLQASQGSFASQFAQSLPMQRLGFTSQLADVQNSLASQAMANRQALLSLGSQIQGAERNFRLNSAERYGSQSSGGGFKGALTGAMAGASAGMGIANLFGGAAPAAAADASFSSPMGQPNVGPQLPVAAAARSMPFSSPMGQPNVGPQLPMPPPPPVFNAFGQMQQFQGPTYNTLQENNQGFRMPAFSQPAFMPYRGY